MITTVNGCILFPHGANWVTSPSQKRTWETEMAASLPGSETRQSLRAVPRRSVQFMITAADLPERARLEARLDAALQTGFGCSALHGREGSLAVAAIAGADSLTLTAGGSWNWQAGDYVLLMADDETFDIAAVLAVAGDVLTLATALDHGWAAQSVIWPVIFGKLTAQKLEGITNWHAAVQLTITEITSSRSVQIGVTPAHVPGVGEQVIGSTNQIG